jgi:hypothetical protein
MSSVDSDSGSKFNGSEFSPPRPIKAALGLHVGIYTGNHAMHSTCMCTYCPPVTEVLRIQFVCGVAEFVASIRREPKENKKKKKKNSPVDYTYQIPTIDSVFPRRVAWPTINCKIFSLISPVTRIVSHCGDFRRHLPSHGQGRQP